MQHHATITIVIDSEDPSTCDICMEMDPEIATDQDNYAAGVGLKMIRALQEQSPESK